MSWDGVIFRAPKDIAVSDLPRDFTATPVGLVADIRALFERCFPGQHHVDGQSSITGADFWLEFNYGYKVADDGTVDSIGVRSNAGDGAIAALKVVCDALDARLFDNQMGEFADFGADTAASMTTFAEFRDRNIGRQA